MFCLTAIRACRPWPSVVAAVTKRQGLNTRSSPVTAAAQAQNSIKKRTQRRKPAVVEDTGQRQGVSRRYFPLHLCGGGGIVVYLRCGCRSVLTCPRIGLPIVRRTLEELNLTI